MKYDWILFSEANIVGSEPYKIQQHRRLGDFSNNNNGVFRNWGPYFYIDVNVYINSWVGRGDRVLFLFNDGDGVCCDLGDRAPFVGLGATDTLTFRAQIGDNPNYRWDITGIPTKQWFNLVIVQSLELVDI